MPETTVPPKMAEIYRKTYDAEYQLLSEAMRARVLACKENNNLKDVEVREFILTVIGKAEAEAGV